VAKPPAIQIRWWLTFLVLLLAVVDLTALAGSFVISRSVRIVAAQAEPMAFATAAIRHEILAAQRDLFRYLSEFADDTAPALGHLTALQPYIAAARQVVGAEGDAAEELDAIQESAERYRKVLELMPRSVEGSRDWSRLQEYSSAAVELGNAVEERASRLAEAAQADIQHRSGAADRIARTAMWVTAGVFALSIVAILILRHWWQRFEDVILGM